MKGCLKGRFALPLKYKHRASDFMYRDKMRLEDDERLKDLTQSFDQEFTNVNKYF